MYQKTVDSYMLRPQQPIVFIGAGLLFGFSGLPAFGR
eukprot:COSAG04_NODE_7518_length_1115_cov_1.634843_3_plen_36_part_01